MERIKPQHSRLALASMLGQLLQRLDRSNLAVGAEQYRSVVRHLAAELEQLRGDAALPQLLDALPSAADLYENLNYAHAGLCRSPLEPALQAELQARQIIERVRRAQPRPQSVEGG